MPLLTWMAPEPKLRDARCPRDNRRIRTRKRKNTGDVMNTGDVLDSEHFEEKRLKVGVEQRPQV